MDGLHTRKTQTATTTIVYAGLLAGMLDGAAASLMYFISSGNHPAKVFQYIASAVFGKKAFAGNPSMVVWGIILHFFIALTFAALLLILYPLFLRVVKHTVLIGIVYGVAVWAIMNLVVVPLTNAPQLEFRIDQAILNVVVLILMVGLPITLIVRRYYSGKKYIAAND